MATFHFDLQPLLSVRETERRQRRAQLAETLDEQRHLLERQAALERELDEQRQLVRRSASPGVLDAGRLLRASRYQLAVRRQLGDLAGQLQTLGLEVERRRQALLEADREVRVLEKLRERKLRRFAERQLAAERRELDEAGQRAISQRPLSIDAP
jgi:flagellar FliJ protein